MAKKRKYEIEINGLKESVTDFDKLSKQIELLKENLKSIKSSKIEIPIDISKNIGNVEKTIKDIQSKLSKNKINVFETNSTDKFNNSLSNLNKTITKNQQSLNDVNDAINTNDKSFGKISTNVDKLDTELVNVNKSITELISRLNELNKNAGNIDAASDEYRSLLSVIEGLSEELETLSSTQTQINNDLKNFSSSVDDVDKKVDKLDNSFKNINESTENTSKNLKDINNNKLDNNSALKYGKTLQELEDSLSRINDQLRNTELGTDEWNRLNEEGKKVSQTISSIQKEMEAAVRAEDQLNTKIKLNINGMQLVFDDVNQAIGVLEDKLYSLSAAGQTNTKEFANIQSEIVRLRKEVIRTDTEIDSLSTSMGGFDKVFGKFKGITTLFALGEGVSALFGDNQELTESIQKMTAIMVILESIKSISEEMNKQSYMGRFFSTISNGIEQTIRLIPGLKQLDKSVSNLFTKYDEFSKANSFSKNFKNQVNDYIKYLNSISNGSELSGLTGLFGELLNANTGKDFLETLIKIKNEQDNLIRSGSLTEEQYKQVDDVLTDLTFNIYNVIKALSKTSISLQNASKMTLFFANSLKVLSTTLKTIGRAVLIGFLIEAISWLINTITDAVKWIGNWVTGNDKLITSLNSVQHEIDATSKSIDKYNKALDSDVNNKLIDNLEKTILSLKNYQKEIKKSSEALKDFIKTREDVESINEGSYRDGGKYTLFGIASDVAEIEDAEERLKEFEKAYLKLMRTVQSESDEKNGSWWFTKGDARADLAEMQKVIINDIQYMFSNIDLTKTGDDLINEFRKVFDKLDTEMYSTALSNLENLFPEEEWAKTLKARIDQVRSMYDEMLDLDSQYQQEKYNIDKQIRDNLTASNPDERERARNELENAYQDEIREAAENEKLINSINEKYARLRLDLERQQNQDILSERISFGRQLIDIEKLIRDNLLSAQKDSLGKTLQELRNSMNDEIDAIKQQFEDNRLLGDKGNPSMTKEKEQEAILSVQKKYDKMIQDEIRNHNESILDIEKEYGLKQQELLNSLNEDLLSDKQTKLENAYKKALDSSIGSFDFSARFSERIEENKAFYDKLLQIELDYIKEKNNLDKMSIENEYNVSISSENNAYQEQLDNLIRMYERGEIELEEYNKFVEMENKRHSQALINIFTNKNNDLFNLEESFLNELKEKTSSSIKDNVSLYQMYIEDVQRLLNNQNVKTNILGIPKAYDMIKNIKEAKSLISKGLSDIYNEYYNLDNKLANNEITFIDYKEAKEQLEQTRESLIQEGENISTALKDILQGTASSYMGMINGWVSTISSLLSTMNDTQMILIDNQLAEIERQLEIQQDAYDKAEEAAEAHKDKMDAIEDELAEARGSRKQFLIETLAAQQDAYLQELEAQQNAEKEKEKLEEKQKALEKKRQEQEKKAKIQQAIINTYTAVTNALAVPPWFVGLALSSIALALGMANVSAIKSTPIYRDGGVIDGPSHENGGVPVLGGKANVEGGEFITNKKTTANNLPLLEYINDTKRPLNMDDMVEFFTSKNKKSGINRSFLMKYENGGQLPTLEATPTDNIQQVISMNDKPVVVDVRDIVRVTEQLNKVQVLSGVKK